MYDAFLYVVANDGVDTASAYPYRGQVTFREIWESHRYTHNTQQG